jgi:dTDP-4-dehydrorhamnose reductase
MKILITGGTGKLGKSLIKAFPESMAPTRKEFDITKKETVFEYIKKNKPDIIIHAAALVDIRLCEADKKMAWKTNVIGTKNIIDAIKNFSHQTFFVYLSTACVFSGESGNYTEESIPNPKNFYSLTKLLGEIETKSLEKYLIIRTNFVPREKWKYPKAFTDRFGTYLFSDDVAMALKDVIKRKIEGIVHICGNRKMSMFQLAKITTPDIKPITLREYSGPHVTKNMTLNTIRWKKYKIGFSYENKKKPAIS